MAIISPEEMIKVLSATDNAKRILKPGDRIRSNRCCGVKTSYTFDGWDRDWVISKSGINDIAACSIDLLNGEPVDFSIPETVTLAEATKVVEHYIKAEKRLKSAPIIKDSSIPF